MRFKAKITTAVSCLALHRLVHAYGKISRSKTARLRLTPRKLCFIVTQEGLMANLSMSASAADAHGGLPKVWAEASQETLFEEYKIESLHENNEILLDISLEHFGRALKSAQSSSSVVMKLTKKDDASYLSINIGTLSGSGLNRPIVHEVPVTIMQEEIERFSLPLMPTPDVNIFLPDARVLKNIIERLKTISEKLIISANREGELILKTETDSVSVKTCFKDLKNPTYRDGLAPADSQPTSPSEFVHARIDAKKFAHFVSGHMQSSWPDALLCIARDQSVLLFLRQEDMCISYMIPILAD